MIFKNTEKINLEPHQIPPRWSEYLMENQLVGGVLLVFIEGKDVEEVRKKALTIEEFTKSFKKKKDLKNTADVKG